MRFQIVESDLSPIAAEYGSISACSTQNKAKRANKIVFLLLIRDQEVDGSNPFAPTIISPLDSILYAALSTATSGPDLGTTGTAEGVFVENVKPSPRIACLHHSAPQKSKTKHR